MLAAASAATIQRHGRFQYCWTPSTTERILVIVVSNDTYEVRIHGQDGSHDYVIGTGRDDLGIEHVQMYELIKR